MNDSHQIMWRLATGAILAAGFILGASYRVRAEIANGREPLNRRAEGLPLLIGIRLVGLMLVGSTVAWLVNPEAIWWASIPIGRNLRIAGLGLIATGFAWIVWVFQTLGSNLTDTVVTRRKHDLITAGPYRWIRHPFYLGLPVIGLGITLATATAIAFPGSLAIFGLLATRAGREERNLEARFGDTYRSYAATTGRFFPRF